MLFCFWIIAEVIVVYCWELSSKNLEEGYLYAPKLGSVSKVPRLIELSKKNSVYSIYKHFNQHQKSAYQRKLKELEDFIKWFLVPNNMWEDYFTLFRWFLSFDLISFQECQLYLHQLQDYFNDILTFWGGVRFRQAFLLGLSL